MASAKWNRLLAAYVLAGWVEEREGRHHIPYPVHRRMEFSHINLDHDDNDNIKHSRELFVIHRTGDTEYRSYAGTPIKIHSQSKQSKAAPLETITRTSRIHYTSGNVAVWVSSHQRYTVVV